MPEVMLRTVAGPIPLSALDGTVLPHEHLRTDLRWAVGIDSDPYRWLDEEQAVAAELHDLRQYHRLGLIVDLSCRGMGRDAAALARIATVSRVPVVAATGFFTEPFVRVGDADADELAAQLMTEITTGLDGSGALPGVIGSVGCWGPAPTPVEERLLIAAARASLAARLPIATYGQDGLGLLEILRAQGVPSSWISISAGDDHAAVRKIVEAGAYVCLSSTTTADPLPLLLGLLADGFGDRILLSSGISRAAQLQRYAGPGYAHLLHRLLPRLRAAGVGEERIHALTHDNPLRWLSCS